MKVSKWMATAAMLTAGITAHSKTITWDVSGVSFDDGGTLSGSFAYNADTGVFSHINLDSTAGTFLPDSSYREIFGAAPSGDQFVGFTPAGPGSPSDEPVLVLFFSDPLTDAGGATSLSSGNAFEALCNNDCASVDALRVVEDGGTITAETSHVKAPEMDPSTALGSMMLLLGGLTVMRGRRGSVPARS